MTEQSDRAEIIDDLGRKWLAEVEELRAVKVPDVDAQPGQVHEALTVTRGSLDRVEEILSMAMSMRSAAEARAGELVSTADDALDKAVVARAARAREFESARERLASASLDTLGQRREARSAQKLADMAVSIEKRVRLRYYGLTGLRDELGDRLRHVSWESSLDR